MAFQRAFSSLQSLHAKAQPALDRAKYKTEASLAPRRGYVRDHASGLLLLSNDEEGDVVGDSPPTTRERTRTFEIGTGVVDRARA